MKTVNFSSGWTLILADKNLLEGEEGAWSFFPQERVFLSSFFPLVQASVSSDWSTNSTSSVSETLSGTYLHSCMPSSCFVCLVFAVFIQLSYFIVLFCWHFFMCKNQPSGQKEPGKSCLFTRAKSKYVSTLGRVYSAQICCPWPRPSHPFPEASAGNWRRVSVALRGRQNPKLWHEILPFHGDCFWNTNFGSQSLSYTKSSGLVSSWVGNVRLKIWSNCLMQREQTRCPVRLVCAFAPSNAGCSDVCFQSQAVNIHLKAWMWFLFSSSHAETWCWGRVMSNSFPSPCVTSKVDIRDKVNVNF